MMEEADRLRWMQIMDSLLLEIEHLPEDEQKKHLKESYQMLEEYMKEEQT